MIKKIIIILILFLFAIAVFFIGNLIPSFWQEPSAPVQSSFNVPAIEKIIRDEDNTPITADAILKFDEKYAKNRFIDSLRDNMFFINNYHYEEKISPLSRASFFLDVLKEKSNTEPVYSDIDHAENTVKYEAKWIKNAVPVSGEALKNPVIAVIIDDMGVDFKMTQLAINLPLPITLSFLPYANNVKKQVELARGRGHEIMLHLPMEPEDENIDPGPNAILTGLSDEELNKRIQWNFSRFDGYVGVNNHMGSKASASPREVKEVTHAILEKGVFVMDSLTSPDSKLSTMAAYHDIDHFIRDVFLDNNRDARLIRKNIRLAENIASNRGYSVIIAHPYEESLKVLDYWMGQAKARGFSVVPASAIIHYLQNKNIQ